MGSLNLSKADLCFLLFPQAELPFRAGDVITVFGNMDDDGFYYVRPRWCIIRGFASWAGIRAGESDGSLEE